ncbi:MAG TPA: HupE/UreJ family protein [Usitatibacter sp.]|nr:HupE/UreJ family protein [Usitatibacter sp.]
MARLQFALWALLLAAATLVRAHDIPTDVRIVAFVKPERGHLTLLVRVPLAAMQDVDVPLRGPGYVDLARAEPALRTAAMLWIGDNLAVTENGAPLAHPAIAAVRISLASDRSFGDYAQALAHLHAAPIPETSEVFWSQQLLDAQLEYPIASERSDFAIRPHLERLGERVATTVRFLPPGGAERAFELHGDPGLVVLDPRWHQAALRFVREGFLHILDGIDHLLFIACLVIPFRKLKPLVIIATAFTVAHSITLATVAMGIAPEGLWFPPLVETLIATSVFYLAIENIFGSSPQRRWVVAFAFGLVHGFGFAFALRESLQFAGSHLVTALVAFNVGVEIGQVAVLVVLVPVLACLFRRVPERLGVIVLSALIAHTAWHWMVERFSDLRKFSLPPMDAATIASAMRWGIAGIALGLVVWLAAKWLRLDAATGEDSRPLRR